MDEKRLNLKIFEKNGITKDEFADLVIDLFRSFEDNPLSPSAFELAMSLLYKKYKLGIDNPRYICYNNIRKRGKQYVRIYNNE